MSNDPVPLVTPPAAMDVGSEARQSRTSFFIRNRLGQSLRQRAEVLRYHNVARKTLEIFILKLLAMVGGYILLLVVSRATGPEGAGVYALGTSVLFVVAMFSTAGTGLAGLRYSASGGTQSKQYLVHLHRNILRIIVPLSALLACTLYLFAPPITQYVFNDRALAPALKVTALIILPYTILGVVSELVRGQQRVATSEILKSTGLIAANVVAFMLILLVVPHSSTSILYLAPLLSYGVAACLMVAIALIIFRRISKATPATETLVQAPGVREILAISLPMLGASAFGLLITHADRLMLAAMSTVEAVGIYTVALKVSLVASIALESIMALSAPAFARLWGQGAKAELASLTLRTSRLLFWASLPLVLPGLIAPGWLLTFFGAEFAHGREALTILLTAQLVNVATGPTGYFMTMTGSQNRLAVIMGVSLGATIGLNLILIPLIGISGAAYSFLFSILLYKLYTTWFIYRHYGICIGYFPLVWPAIVRR